MTRINEQTLSKGLLIYIALMLSFDMKNAKFGL